MSKKRMLGATAVEKLVNVLGNQDAHLPAQLPQLVVLSPFKRGVASQF